MKRKLGIVLLLAVLTTVLLSTAVAAAAEEWGFGGWDVAKRQTEWKPDGVWTEGEYYSVDPAYDTKNVQGSNEDYWNKANDLNYMLAMSWDEEYLYTYISYHEPDEWVVTGELWDGSVVQFSGTDVGEGTAYNDQWQVTYDPRLEIGIAKDFMGQIGAENTKISTNWCDWLGSGYAAQCGDVDDFEVFFCDGWVTYEFRVPFSAFSKIEPAVNGQVGVAYVIATANGDGAFAHTQIGKGITGGKHAEEHSRITLTDTPDISVQFPETVYRYGILFHNIGMNTVRGDYRNFWFEKETHYQNLDETTAFCRDLMGIIAHDSAKLEELTNVEGHQFVCFRPVYWNRVDDVFTVVEDQTYTLEDMASLEDEELLQYAWYDNEDTWCIMFTACYDPDMYTVKFNNIGNVDNWDNTNYYTARKVEHVPFGTNFYDIFPYEWDYPDLFNVPGHYFDRWRVLDFDNEIENPGYEQQYKSSQDAAMHYGGGNGFYPLDSFIAGHASVQEDSEYPVITLRAVYLPYWYTVRFVDDDGVTDLREPVQLRIWDGIREHFPDIPTKDYGTFTGWKLDWVNGEDGFYTMWYDDEANPNYPIDENLLEKCAVDTNDDGVADTITLVAEYERNEDAGDLRDNGIISTENGDIEWEVHWDGLLFVGNHNGAEGLVIPDYEPWNDLYAPWHAYRTYITKLEIGREIGVVGSYAFMDLERIPEVIIPGNVKEIKAGAFEGCRNVEYIELNEGLELIGYDVFAGCNTEEMWIPSTVIGMKRGAFAHLGTYRFNVHWENPVFHQGQGVLYYQKDEDQYTLMAYPKWDERETLVVPDGVDTIGGSAFKWAEKLKSVILPDSLLSIEDSAFSRSGVDNIHVPAGLVFLNDYAFEGATNLSDIYFYGPVPKDRVGRGVFQETAEDFTLHYLEGQEGWTEGTWDSPHTTDVVEEYPTASFTMGDYRATGVGPARNDRGQIAWTISWDGELYIEGVEGSHESGEYGMPDANIFDAEPTYAPWYEWRNYVNRITLADNINWIGSGAFYDFDALETINIPGHIRFIGDHAFRDCNMLWDVGLNEGLEMLGGGAFAYVSLDHLWIPASLTEINIDYTFEGLWANWYDVAEDNPYFYMDDHGALCYRRIYEDGNEECLLLAIPGHQDGSAYTVSDGIKKLPPYVFMGRDYTQVILPDTLEWICHDVFHGMNRLQSIHIPASVGGMDWNVFMNCRSLRDIYFYGDQPWMDPLVFNTIAEDLTIHYTEGNEGWSTPAWDNPETEENEEIPCYPFRNDDVQFEGTIDEIGITWYITADGKLYVNGSGEIPDNVWDYGYNWHDHMGSIREIHLDDNITRIGNYAFNGVNYLTKLTLPESLTEIGENAFNGRYCSIGTLVLPYQVENIRYAAFHDMGITKAVIPEATSFIHDNVFAGNPISEFVVTGDNAYYKVDEYGVLYGLDENGDYIFMMAYPVASDRTDLVVQKTVDTLGDHAVHQAYNLESIVLPEKLDWIAHQSLSYNSNLTTITIPATVRAMAPNALCNNGRMTSVIFLGDKPELIEEEGGSHFEYNAEGFTIYYYEGAEGWADYDLYPTQMIGEGGILYSGTIAETDITWTLDVDGVLTVNGSGIIPDGIWETDSSWHDYKHSVREIRIGEGITRIGDHAFSGFGNTAVLSLPDSLEEIGHGAFHDTALTQVTIPAATRDVKNNAFAGSPVEEFIVDEGNPWHTVDEYGALYYMEDGSYGYLIAYPAASEGTELVVKDGTHTICAHAIYGTSLTSITLPDSLRHIRYAGICFNEDLTSLTIPASVGELEERALGYNSSLSSILFEGGKPNLWSEEDGQQFEGNPEDFTIYYYDGAEGWADYTLYPTVALRKTTKGDVTGDGKVTDHDLSLLTLYFAGYPTDVDLSAADIDGENGLTRKDIMILKRYLHGWEGYDAYFAE